ncbi:hypothetical protein [Clavibacter californiensis]|uniref:hypothetical protein n=1 Tax=Clavibacter californiensis TaxID=1401995 RepID=UPI0015FDA748|nr:hypothetical protein [Clavibacter californiensis]UKF80478.1 hypothetical protein FGD68_02160 [Clavibacter californiensis]
MSDDTCHSKEEDLINAGLYGPSRDDEGQMFHVKHDKTHGAPIANFDRSGAIHG